MAELERRLTVEKDLAHDTVKADLEQDDPEYTEYLALAQEYSGEKLKKLQVCLYT
jgi:hypothetical protein